METDNKKLGGEIYDGLISTIILERAEIPIIFIAL